MRALTQSKSQQAASELFDAAVREQERLRTTLTPEELEQDRRLKFEALNRLSEQVSRQARANGLTEEILNDILAEE